MSPGTRFLELVSLRFGRSATLWTYMPTQARAAAATIECRDRSTGYMQHSGAGCERRIERSEQCLTHCLSLVERRII